MSELTKMIKVPLWELKEISDTLRMVANALDSPKRESCLDRNVMRSWNYVVDMIKGKIPSAPESIDYAPSNIRKAFEDHNAIRWAYVSDLINQTNPKFN